MKKKYAFIKIRSAHTVVSQIVRILAHAFPEYEIDVVNIKDILKKNPHVMIINIFHMLTSYGIGTLFEERSTIYNRFFGTPYMYRQIRRLLNKETKGGRYLFTFQDCSLFNGKIDSVPNFVYTDHTVKENRFYPDFLEKRDMLSDDWLKLEGEIYRDASVVFTRYKKIASSLINEYSCEEEKVKNIYYAPNIAIPNEEKISMDKYFSKNILFIGIDWYRKGGEQLLSAFDMVLENVPGAKLTIIGCTPEISLRNVHVVGKIKSEELPKYFDGAAVFCMPTRKEHAGIVFTEAMGYALPLIGTRIGAIPEYIDDGKNGYLVDVDDVAELADRLTRMVENPGLCAEFGLNSYGRYKEFFTLNTVAQKIRNSITEEISR